MKLSPFELERRRARVARVTAKRPPIAGVELVRHDVDDPARRRELVRLLRLLLDKPATPGNGR